MSYALLKDLRFFQLLHRVDQELAAEARAGGCVFCGGVLHVTADLKLVLVSRRETGFSFVMQKSKRSLSFLVWRFFGLLQHTVKHLGCHRPVSPINFCSGVVYAGIKRTIFHAVAPWDRSAFISANGRQFHAGADRKLPVSPVSLTK